MLRSVMGLASFKAGLNVFKQGDVGNLFYIVLQGEVDVFVNHMGIQFKACTYQVGGSFGERALLTSEPRAATVTCTTNSDFLVIGRRDYLRVLREVHEREFMSKIRFIKTVRYFEKLPNTICEEIAQKFSKKRFGRNEVIVREGAKRTHLFVIRSGECRVLKTVNLGGKQGTVQIETRLLTSRDFFCEDESPFNKVSVLSKSFAEVFTIHINDLKSSERVELQKCLENMKNYADQFKQYADEERLKEMYLKQVQWDTLKRKVLGEIVRRNQGDIQSKSI